jgi:hypothetical protein
VTNQFDQGEDEARGTLSATRDLTQRVRLAQRGAWFPLLVFAAVTFAAIPFSRYGPHPTHCSTGNAGGYVCMVQPALALWYWPVALLAGYVVISWFYQRLSEHRGVGTRVQPYVVVGAVLTVLIAAWAFWSYAHPAFLVDTLWRRGDQPGQFVHRLASPAGAIGLALLLLAWIERSRALLVVTVLYLIVAVATVGLGASFAHPTPWAFLPHLLIDGGVLLVGGILIAATRRA